MVDVGVDIVSIPRIESAISRFGSRFLVRFLSADELSSCWKRGVVAEGFDPKRVAGLWAAKESLSKALGVGIGGKLSFLDICVTKTSRGKPVVTLSKDKLKEFRVSSISTSISHDGSYAIAASAVFYIT